MMLPIALTLLAILLAYLSVRHIVVAPLRRAIASLQRENIDLQNRCDAWARSEAAVSLNVTNLQRELQKETAARTNAVKASTHWHTLWQDMAGAVGERNQENRTLELAVREMRKELERVAVENETRRSKLNQAGLAIESLKKLARRFRTEKLEAQTKYNTLRREAQQLNQDAVNLEEELKDVREFAERAQKAAEHFEKQVYELQSASALANTKSPKRVARARR